MTTTENRTMGTTITWQQDPRRGFGSLLSQAASGLLNRLLLWQQRASDRAHLAALSDRDLADVGLKRSELRREIAKPFWEP